MSHWGDSTAHHRWYNRPSPRPNPAPLRISCRLPKHSRAGSNQLGNLCRRSAPRRPERFQRRTPRIRHRPGMRGSIQGRTRGIRLPPAPAAHGLKGNGCTQCCQWMVGTCRRRKLWRAAFRNKGQPLRGIAWEVGLCWILGHTHDRTERLLTTPGSAPGGTVCNGQHPLKADARPLSIRHTRCFPPRLERCPGRKIHKRRHRGIC